MPAIKEPKLSP